MEEDHIPRKIFKFTPRGKDMWEDLECDGEINSNSTVVERLVPSSW